MIVSVLGAYVAVCLFLWIHFFSQPTNIITITNTNYLIASQLFDLHRDAEAYTIYRILCIKLFRFIYFISTWIRAGHLNNVHLLISGKFFFFWSDPKNKGPIIFRARWAVKILYLWKFSHFFALQTRAHFIDIFGHEFWHAQQKMDKSRSYVLCMHSSKSDHLMVLDCQVSRLSNWKLFAPKQKSAPLRMPDAL